MNAKNRGLIGILVLVLIVAFSASPAFAAKGGVGQGVATHIIVFNDGVDAGAATAALARAHGLGVTNVYRHALSGAAAVVPPGRLHALERDPRVAFVEANQVVSIFDHVTPNGILRANADVSNTNYSVDADIAIIDTGIELDNPDLNVFKYANCARKGPLNTSCNENDDGADDGNGHGTHVAGTAAAKNNNIGAVGMAPGARLWAVKVLGNDGSGWMNWIIGGIDYVTANADQIDVANMSLGCKCDSNALDAALTNSVAAGVTFAVAAGNSMEDASTFSPANHPDVITVSAMADFDGVGGGLTDTTVTFGICTEYEDDSFACFSNYGEDVNIAAPGVNILSTALGGGTATMSGTSMASPHVAGAAALHIALNGKPTNATEALAVRAALVAAGTDQNHVDGFTGDPDNYAEPLLNVATLSGSGGGTVPTNNAPNADFSFSTSLLEASFTDLSSDSDGSIASWDWNFGDGNNSTSQNPIHTYLFSGTYSVMLTVMDNEGATNSVSNNVTVSDGSGGSTTTVSVDSITYATAGGKNGDKHLNVTVALLDDLLNPVSGASVSITLNNTTADESWMGAGGTVTYTLKNAPSGMYTTTVTDVTASGLTWDNVTPANFFDK